MVEGVADALAAQHPIADIENRAAQARMATLIAQGVQRLKDGHARAERGRQLAEEEGKLLQRCAAKNG
jgi:hypothetical protein